MSSPLTEPTAASLSRRERLYASTLFLVALSTATSLLVWSPVDKAFLFIATLTALLSTVALLERTQWIGALEIGRLLLMLGWAHFLGSREAALIGSASLGQLVLLVAYAMSGGNSLLRGDRAVVDAQEIDSLDGWAQ